MNNVLIMIKLSYSDDYSNDGIILFIIIMTIIILLIKKNENDNDNNVLD